MIQSNSYVCSVIIMLPLNLWLIEFKKGQKINTNYLIVTGFVFKYRATEFYDK